MNDIYILERRKVIADWAAGFADAPWPRIDADWRGFLSLLPSRLDLRGADASPT